MKTTFRPRKGIAIDPSPSELSPDYWSDAFQFRFVDGRAVPFRFAQGLPALPGNAIPLHVVTGVPDIDLPNNGGVPDQWWLAVTADSIYVTSATDGVWTDIGGGGIVTDPALTNQERANRLVSTILNGTPWLGILGPDASNYLGSWARDASVDYQPLDPSKWPAGAILLGGLCAHKYHLFTFGFGEFNDFNENTVMWSSAVEPGQSQDGITFIPTPSNDSGSVDLADTPGMIIDACSVGDYIWLAKERALYTAQFIGGQSVFAFRLRNDSVGVASRHCMQEVNNRLFIVTPGDCGFVAPDGTFTSVAEGRVREFITATQDNVTSQLGDEAAGVFTMHHPDKKEVWIYARVTVQDSALNRELWIYNYVQDTWGQANVAANMFPVCGRFGRWPWALNTDAGGDDFVVMGGFNGANGILCVADAMNDFTIGNIPAPYLRRQALSLSPDDPQQFHLVNRMNVLSGEIWQPEVPFEDNILDVAGKAVRAGPVIDQDSAVIDYYEDQVVPVVVRGRYVDVELEMDSRSKWVDGFTVDHEPVGYY